MKDFDGLRRDLRGLAADLAAVKFASAVRRYIDGRKFDPHPVRQPAGARIAGRGVGGQFAGKGRAAAASAARGAALQGARAALAEPAAAGTAGASVLPLAAGGIAMSRQAGLYEHYVDGQAITPILHLPGGKLETGPPPLRMSLRGGGGVDLRAFDEGCDEQLDKDLLTCQIDSAMYG